MVGRKGLEPSHLAAREPKSRVSTNSTTGPLFFRFYVELKKLTTKNIFFFMLIFSIVFWLKLHKSKIEFGPVVELVDTLDLGSSAARCEGSSPFRPTISLLDI